VAQPLTESKPPTVRQGCSLYPLTECPANIDDLKQQIMNVCKESPKTAVTCYDSLSTAIAGLY
jgi:hypothetical protein